MKRIFLQYYLPAVMWSWKYQKFHFHETFNHFPRCYYMFVGFTSGCSSVFVIFCQIYVCETNKSSLVFCLSTLITISTISKYTYLLNFSSSFQNESFFLIALSPIHKWLKFFQKQKMEKKIKKTKKTKNDILTISFRV